MKDEMTTIWIRSKDRDYLDKLKNKFGLKGKSVVIEKMINLIKFQKSEKDLK